MRQRMLSSWAQVFSLVKHSRRMRLVRHSVSCDRRWSERWVSELIARSSLRCDTTSEVIMSVQEMTRTEQETLVHATGDVYDDGFLRVEHKNYYVSCGGSPIKLSRTEFLLFSRLVRTPNRIVTADELWSSVWGSNKPLNTESLHVYVYRLRAKLADFGLQIETMVNVGYRLILSKT